MCFEGELQHKGITTTTRLIKKRIPESCRNCRIGWGRNGGTKALWKARPNDVGRTVATGNVSVSGWPRGGASGRNSTGDVSEPLY